MLSAQCVSSLGLLLAFCNNYGSLRLPSGACRLLSPRRNACHWLPVLFTVYRTVSRGMFKLAFTVIDLVNLSPLRNACLGLRLVGRAIDSPYLVRFECHQFFTGIFTVARIVDRAITAATRSVLRSSPAGLWLPVAMDMNYGETFPVAQLKTCKMVIFTFSGYSRRRLDEPGARV